MKDGSDVYVKKELRRAWIDLPFHLSKYSRTHHDWTNFRQATLREARKRGLNISVTEVHP